MTIQIQIKILETQNTNWPKMQKLQIVEAISDKNYE